MTGRRLKRHTGPRRSTLNRRCFFRQDSQKHRRHDRHMRTGPAVASSSLHSVQRFDLLVTLATFAITMPCGALQAGPQGLSERLRVANSLLEG